MATLMKSRGGSSETSSGDHVSPPRKRDSPRSSGLSRPPLEPSGFGPPQESTTSSKRPRSEPLSSAVDPSPSAIEVKAAGSERSSRRTSGARWSTIYDGLMQCPIPSLFGDEGSARELDHLRTLAEASLSRWQCTRGELQWTLLSGDLASRQGQLAEITIPASGLSPRHRTELYARNRSTVLRPSTSPQLEEFQEVTSSLATKILRFFRRQRAELPPGIFFIGAQLTSSPPYATRSRHVDSSSIAAALATVTLSGSAIITVEAGPATPHVQFECSPSGGYLVTGPSLVEPIHHRVDVGPESRLSITFRFSNPAHPSFHRGYG